MVILPGASCRGGKLLSVFLPIAFVVLQHMTPQNDDLPIVTSYRHMVLIFDARDESTAVRPEHGLGVTLVFAISSSHTRNPLQCSGVNNHRRSSAAADDFIIAKIDDAGHPVHTIRTPDKHDALVGRQGVAVGKERS